MNMKSFRRVRWSILFFAGSFSLAVSGQTETTPSPAGQKTEKPNQSGGTARDPFAVSGELQAYANSGAIAVSGSPRFTAHASPQTLPKMRMRGFLKGKNGESVALLEVDGGQVHIVRAGDTIGLHGRGSNAGLKIKSIDRLHLVVESGTLGQTIIVR